MNLSPLVAAITKAGQGSVIRLPSNGGTSLAFVMLDPLLSYLLCRGPTSEVLKLEASGEAVWGDLHSVPIRNVGALSLPTAITPTIAEAVSKMPPTTDKIILPPPEPSGQN